MSPRAGDGRRGAEPTYLGLDDRWWTLGAFASEAAWIPRERARADVCTQRQDEWPGTRCPTCLVQPWLVCAAPARTSARMPSRPPSTPSPRLRRIDPGRRSKAGSRDGNSDGHSDGKGGRAAHVAGQAAPRRNLAKRRGRRAGGRFGLASLAVSRVVCTSPPRLESTRLQTTPKNKTRGGRHSTKTGELARRLALGFRLPLRLNQEFPGQPGLACFVFYSPCPGWKLQRPILRTWF